MPTISRRTLLKLSLAAPAVLLATTARAATHQVTIVNMEFQPANLTIAAGDTIVFANQDNAPHTATDDAGAFDTGRLTGGASAQLTFPSAGQFAYHCDIHRMMKGTITVS